MWRFHPVFLIIACVHIATCEGQTFSGSAFQIQPCDNPNAIRLPQDRKCLVPVENSATWVEASATCESTGGRLYQTPPDARLESRPNLMRCISSMTDIRYHDMWLNAVGRWSPHFMWINGTLLNKIDYCVDASLISYDGSAVYVASDTLSVDYCVSSCHDVGARYIVLVNDKTPKCFCKTELPALNYPPCRNIFFDASLQQSYYYIVHSKEASLIKISSADAFARTEILCATVDPKTLEERQMKSDTCFTRHQFICCLGEADKCVDTICSNPECRFYMGKKCMLRVSLNYNWHEARAYCVKLGGDLWNMHEFDEMSQINMNLDGTSAYWIGATNYGWNFNATSNIITDGNTVPNTLRCGHMFMERDSTTSSSWEWSDADCNEKKAFFCQYADTNFNQEDAKWEVLCPWVVPTIPTTTISGGVSSLTDASNNTVIFPEPQIGSYDEGDSFPIAAVIAGIIAGIILLTCLALGFAWCTTIPRMAGSFKKVHKRLAFIPYFANVSGAHYGGHGIMASASDHGSQVGLVRNEFQSAASGCAMTSSFEEQNATFASRSMGAHHQQAISGGGRAEGHSWMHGSGSSMAQRGFSSTNGARSGTSGDLMTLQAQMSIQDEAAVAAMRESFRRKPEVALVTDHVDMNFTVNHASSQGHSLAGSNMSRSSVDRTLEEVIMPVSEGGLGINLPERVAEEARTYATLRTSYNV